MPSLRVADTMGPVSPGGGWGQGSDVITRCEQMGVKEEEEEEEEEEEDEEKGEEEEVE